MTTGALTQTGGELNGSGTLTVTGTGSLLTGGTESGSGTTIVQGGVSFGNGSPGPVNFGLDGGRTLQLGGTSTATSASNGAIVYDRSERDQSEHRAERCRLGHADDPERGDVQRRDDDDYWTVDPCHQPWQQRHRCERGGEQPGHLPEVRLGDDFDDLHAVQQHRHGGRRERDAEPVGRRHRCRRDLQGPRHGQFQRRHAHAGCRLEHPGNATFSGGANDGERRHRHRLIDGHRRNCDLRLAP